MIVNRAIKIRIYPNEEQKEFLNKSFGCCRFVYNKMLEERKEIYDRLKENKRDLYDYKYKTEKEYKQQYPFLKEVYSHALQTERRHLQLAYDNFFRNVKKRIRNGFPKFKNRKSKQSFTTFNINDNCKLDFTNKKLKLPKLKTWIKYRDNRTFTEHIKQITISKTKNNKYYASILIEKEINVNRKQILEEDKIVGFDMSASKVLITKELELSNPRFYRNEESKLKKLHREMSRKKKGSNNRNKAKLNLSKLYERIYNRKNDWTHKLTRLLSEQFDCIVLENLNEKGMQSFNSGFSKSVSLDFSWNQFVNALKYKLEDKGKRLILINRYFPSSKLCSNCDYKNNDLELNERKWICPKCTTEHDRDINASINIKNEGLRILKKQNITVISNIDNAVGTTVKAFGENVRLTIPSQQLSMKHESTPFKMW